MSSSSAFAPYPSGPASWDRNPSYMSTGKSPMGLNGLNPTNSSFYPTTAASSKDNRETRANSASSSSSGTAPNAPMGTGDDLAELLRRLTTGSAIPAQQRKSLPGSSAPSSSAPQSSSPPSFGMSDIVLAHVRALASGHAKPATDAGFWPPPCPSSTSPDNKTVFVGALPSTITPDELRMLFEPFGDIETANCPPGRGCGFVTFYRRDSAEAAIEKMQGFPVNGSRLRPSWGHSQRDKGGRSCSAPSAVFQDMQFLGEFLDLDDTQKQKLQIFNHFLTLGDIGHLKALWESTRPDPVPTTPESVGPVTPGTRDARSLPLEPEWDATWSVVQPPVASLPAGSDHMFAARKSSPPQVARPARQHVAQLQQQQSQPAIVSDERLYQSFGPIGESRPTATASCGHHIPSGPAGWMDSHTDRTAWSGGVDRVPDWPKGLNQRPAGMNVAAKPWVSATATAIKGGM